MAEDDAITEPMIKTILERIDALGKDLRNEIDTLGKELRSEIEVLRRMISVVDIRLDRLESLASVTRGKMLALRADFNELKEQLKERIPELR